MSIKVVIIGAGRRVAGGLIPAVHCLSSTHELIGVYGRHEKFICYGAHDPAFEVKAGVSAAAVEAADLILVAVPMPDVKAVLRNLTQYDVSRAILMLDTPVAPFSDLTGLMMLRRFKASLVLEDMVALPAIRLTRALIDGGAIGGLKRIILFHNGYKYHAAAMVRALTGANGLGLVRSRRFRNGRGVQSFSLRGGVEIVLFEPRDYERGKLLVEGEAGTIADFDFAGPHRRIEYMRGDYGYSGLLLDGRPIAPEPADLLYRTLLLRDIPRWTLMNAMKVRALLDLLTAAPLADSRFQYSVRDGLIDRAVVAFAAAAGVAADIRGG